MQYVDMLNMRATVLESLREKNSVFTDCEMETTPSLYSCVHWFCVISIDVISVVFISFVNLFFIKSTFVEIY